MLHKKEIIENLETLNTIINRLNKIYQRFVRKCSDNPELFNIISQYSEKASKNLSAFHSIYKPGTFMEMFIAFPTNKNINKLPLLFFDIDSIINNFINDVKPIINKEDDFSHYTIIKRFINTQSSNTNSIKNQLREVWRATNKLIIENNENFL